MLSHSGPVSLTPHKFLELSVPEVNAAKDINYLGDVLPDLDDGQIIRTRSIYHVNHLSIEPESSTVIVCSYA